MTKPIRYTMKYDPDLEDTFHEPDPTGEYVSFDNYDKLRTERDKLQEALYAGYMMRHGRAHIRSRSDIPMKIGDAQRERIIRAALQPTQQEEEE